MKGFLLFLIVLVLAGVRTAEAEMIDVFELPDEFKREIRHSLSQSLNGFVIFSASGTLGTGSFRFSEEDEPDSKMDVYRIVKEIKLNEWGQEGWTPYIRAGLGHLRLRERITPLEGEGDNDVSHFRTSSLVLGTGVEYRITDSWFLTPGVDVIYSHSRNRYRFNNPSSQELEQVLDRSIFNWNIDSLSYTPQLYTRYEAKVSSYKIIPSLGYTHVFLHSLRSSSSYVNASTSSGILNYSLAGEIPARFRIMQGEAFWIPSFTRTELFRDARHGLGFNSYHQIELSLLSRQQNYVPWFSEVGVTGSYAFASGLRGWSVGLEAAF